MADRTISDRLQPSLLDRLTDNAPEATTESRAERVIDISRLREIISRDLAWLLNTSNREKEYDPKLYPHVAQSTLNYGIREVAGDFSTVRRAQEIQKAIRDAVERFEPRIASGSTRVDIREQDEQSQTIIHFDIRAEMWAQPMPQELYLRTRVDVVTGELNLDRVG